MAIIVAVHALVLPAILQNKRQIVDDCRMFVRHHPWHLQQLVVVVGSVGATSCGRCVRGGGFLSVINKGCNVTGVLYTRI